MKRVLPIWTMIFMLVLSFISIEAAEAQDRLSITGQIRQRTEHSGKDFNADVDNPTFTFLRTRLNVGVAATEDVKVFVQFQDSRVWGGAGGTIAGSAPALDAHQAYFTVSNVFDTDFSAKVGRQEINIGNQRLVGAVGWHNIGRTFDAAILKYAGENASFQVLASRLVGATGVATGQSLYGVTVTYPYEGGRVEGLGLLDTDSGIITGGADAGERLRSRITAGAAAYGAKSDFDYELEGYYQTGDVFEAGTGELGSLGAYLASAKVGYTVNSDNKLRIGGLFTLVSGDEDGADGDVGNFNTLFATNHKFYGFMDYFIGPGSFAKGLQDIGLSLSVMAKEDLKLSVDLHQFSGTEVASGLDDVYGQEIDVTLNYKYNSAMTIVAGVSAFMPGDDFVGADPDNAYWGYISTIVNF